MTIRGQHVPAWVSWVVAINILITIVATMAVQAFTLGGEWFRIKTYANEGHAAYQALYASKLDTTIWRRQ